MNTATPLVAANVSVSLPLAQAAPLVVDLDHALLRSDSLIDALACLVRAGSAKVLSFPRWLLRGRDYAVHRTAAWLLPEAAFMPCRPEVLTFLQAQKAAGRRLILLTSNDPAVSEAIATQIGLFEQVVACPSSPVEKSRRMVSMFGLRGFDFLGGRSADIPIWQAARMAFVATRSAALQRRVAKYTPVEAALRESRLRTLDYMDALRPLHWIKNALVFVPLVAMHRQWEGRSLLRVCIVVLAFDLCASGQYLFNDVLDLPADRHDPHKRTRMIASGRLNLGSVLALMVGLVLGGLALASQISRSVAMLTACYVLLMMVYSVRMKRTAIVDVLMLAGGYSLRVAAGAWAVDIQPSSWLFMVSVSLFFSLALIKRYTALPAAAHQTEPAAGRYSLQDKPVLLAQGIASGYIAVAVMALYANSDLSRQLYPRHEFLWPCCLLLLYWVSYLWLMAGRGRIVGDPVVFAISDPTSRWVLVVFVALVTFVL